ncbi:MAG: FAD-dependent oxidoreductase [Methanomassiliicoccales archaeon]|jgi:heterodisulfide reductase subunit A
MIGLFICHCGTNIAGVVNIESLKEHFSSESTYVLDHLFLCSKAGQEMIINAVKENHLDKVVIAACSPKHHGEIFKECLGQVINPYLWEMVNIREQCAWTTSDQSLATEKAKALIHGAVERVKFHEPIYSIRVPLKRSVAVIGAGIAGIHAALELADKGIDVELIEMQPIIGGNMVRLNRTFPTDDCAMCTISPILNRVMMHRKIRLWTMTDVEEVRGRPGEYHIRLKRRARFVDYDKCTGCGNCSKGDLEVRWPLPAEPYLVDRLRIDPERCTGCGACVKKCGTAALTQPAPKEKPKYDTLKCNGCWDCVRVCRFDAISVINVCPVVVPNEFDLGLGLRKAIYIPNPQSVPLKYLRDPDHCLRLKGLMDCRGCIEVCGPGAIRDGDVEQVFEITVGAVIVATGYREYDLSGSEYQTEHPNVITGLQLERMLSPAGPTQGKLVKPSDGTAPKSVTFVQCAGSRDTKRREYCSKICCMYAVKNASLIKRDHPEIDVKVCYIDLRASGRGYEEYFDRAREIGVEFIRGNVGEIVPIGHQLVVKCEDTFLGRPREIVSDLVVLSVAMEPSEGTQRIARIASLVTGKDGFIAPVHVKIAPVDTALSGIFVCGTAEAPKPIQECITDAGTAASRTSNFLKEDGLIVDLVTAVIDQARCIRCGKCAEICSYDAIRNDEGKYEVIEIACKACGKCAADCPSNAIDLRFNNDLQLESAAAGIIEYDTDSIIAYACEQCGYNAADLAGAAKYYYSTAIKIVKVPCSGRVSLAQMLLPFEYGAKGVMIAACLDGQCHFIDGNRDAAKRVEVAKRVLDLMGVGGHRLQFFNISSSEGGKFVEAAEKILKDTEEA